MKTLISSTEMNLAMLQIDVVRLAVKSRLLSACARTAVLDRSSLQVVRMVRGLVIAVLPVITLCLATSGDDSIAEKPRAEAAAKAEQKPDQQKAEAVDKEKTAAAAAIDEKKEKAAKNNEKKDEAAKPANIEALGATLRLLFGGVPVKANQAEVVVDPNDVAIQNEAMVQQFMQQYRPLMTSELMFVRLVCSDLAPEHRPKVKAAAEVGLKKAAQSAASPQIRQGVVARTMRIEGANRRDPRTTIRDGITVALKDALTEKQLEKYKRESDDRDAARKHATILCAVSHLDGALFLTTGQRDKIVESISGAWDPSWETWLMLPRYGNQYYPTVPDHLITPHLSSDQKTIWQSLQKVNFGFAGGGRGQQNMDNDGWWGEELEFKL